MVTNRVAAVVVPEGTEPQVTHHSRGQVLSDSSPSHTSLWKLTLWSGNSHLPVASSLRLTLFPEFWNAILPVGQC